MVSQSERKSVPINVPIYTSPAKKGSSPLNRGEARL
jgi:hypothetical protein